MHTIRSKLVKDKVALSNQIRGLLLEYGIAIPQSHTHLPAALSDLNGHHLSDLTEQTKIIFSELYTEFLNLVNRIADYTKKITTLAQEDENSRKLTTIPGIGEITATAMIATVGNFHTFKNGRGLLTCSSEISKKVLEGFTRISFSFSERCKHSIVK